MVKSSIGMAFLVSLVLQGCALTGDQKQVTWYAAVAAPERYRVWVEHWEFEKSGERHWYHPAGSLGCCWQGKNGPSGVSARLEPFPNYIAIQWFSFAEQKFYQRLIAVPPEWKELMKVPAPIKSPKGVRMEPRNTLLFGLAPGGEIVVWILNQIGNEIEVARLQANEIDGDPSKYQAKTERYQEKHGDYLSEHGLQLGKW